MSTDMHILALLSYETIVGAVLLLIAVYFAAAVRRRDLVRFTWLYAVTGACLIIYGSVSPPWPEQLARAIVTTVALVAGIALYRHILRVYRVPAARHRILEIIRHAGDSRQ